MKREQVQAIDNQKQSNALFPERVVQDNGSTLLARLEQRLAEINYVIDLKM